MVYFFFVLFLCMQMSDKGERERGDECGFGQSMKSGKGFFIG